jgi:hypothetical protein
LEASGAPKGKVSRRAHHHGFNTEEHPSEKHHPTRKRQTPQEAHRAKQQKTRKTSYSEEYDEGTNGYEVDGSE